MQNNAEFNSSTENIEGTQESEQLKKELWNGYRAPLGPRFPCNPGIIQLNTPESEESNYDYMFGMAENI